MLSTSNFFIYYLDCFFGNGSNDLDQISYSDKTLLNKFIFIGVFPEKRAFTQKQNPEQSSVAQIVLLICRDEIFLNLEFNLIYKISK